MERMNCFQFELRKCWCGVADKKEETGAHEEMGNEQHKMDYDQKDLRW